MDFMTGLRCADQFCCILGNMDLDYTAMQNDFLSVLRMHSQFRHLRTLWYNLIVSRPAQVSLIVRFSEMWSVRDNYCVQPWLHLAELDSRIVFGNSCRAVVGQRLLDLSMSVLEILGCFHAFVNSGWFRGQRVQLVGLVPALDELALFYEQRLHSCLHWATVGVSATISAQTWITSPF
jgi:hypothetical protein